MDCERFVLSEIVWMLFYRIQVHRGCKLVDVDFDNRRAWIKRLQPSTIFDVGYSLLVGADGWHSKVRRLLQAHDPSLACEEVGSRMMYQAFAGLPLEGALHA